MGTSSKLIMTTGINKDELEILAVAKNSINQMLKEERGKSVLPWTKDENNSSFIHIETNPDSRSFTLIFNLKGESRQLWLHTKCDQDNYDIVKKPNVSFSLNAWGNHKEILQRLQKNLENSFQKSQFFFDFNDCDDIYHKVVGSSLKEKSLPSY